MYNYLLFVVFLISLLFDGIVAEGIMLVCASIIFLINRNNNKKIIGKQLFKKSTIFIFFFFGLYLLHIFLINNRNVDCIRLYGLTKCICAPAIVFLVFPKIFQTNSSILLLSFIMIIFNLIYGISGIGNNPDTINYQLGSFNGCSGIGVIMFPIIVYYLRSSVYKKNKEKVLLFLFIISTLWVIYISESTTTLVIICAQLIVLIIFSKRMISIIKNRRMLVCILTIISLALISILIANHTIDLDPSGLKTRVGIWSKAYLTFISQDNIHIIFGQSDCMVQMESKILQAHNAFLEILMIYGIVGIVFFLLACISFIRLTIYKIKDNKSVYILLSLVSYFLFCFLHPFYTGVFIFQIICVCSIGFILYHKKHNINQLQNQ